MSAQKSALVSIIFVYVGKVFFRMIRRFLFLDGKYNNDVFHCIQFHESLAKLQKEQGAQSD